MPVETENYSAVAYQLIASVCQTQGCRKRVVYGIKADYLDETTQTLKIKDISPHKSDVLRLILLLNECGAAKEHFRNIVEDFVQEL
jgi:hypothetical protein